MTDDVFMLPSEMWELPYFGGAQTVPELIEWYVEIQVNISQLTPKNVPAFKQAFSAYPERTRLCLRMFLTEGLLEQGGRYLPTDNFVKLQKIFLHHLLTLLKDELQSCCDVDIYDRITQQFKRLSAQGLDQLIAGLNSSQAEQESSSFPWEDEDDTTNPYGLDFGGF